MTRVPVQNGHTASIAVALEQRPELIAARADAAKKIPRRMVAIETNMGIMPQFFFPEKAGRDYALTPYLEKLAAHREQIHAAVNARVAAGAREPVILKRHDLGIVAA